jgi:hypothetical protein
MLAVDAHLTFPLDASIAENRDLPREARAVARADTLALDDVGVFPVHLEESHGCLSSPLVCSA